jgi:hypothetical protein
VPGAAALPPLLELPEPLVDALPDAEPEPLELLLGELAEPLALPLAEPDVLELVELPEVPLPDPACPGELPQALSTMAAVAIRAVAATTRVFLIDCPPWGAKDPSRQGVPIDSAGTDGQPCAH